MNTSKITIGIDASRSNVAQKTGTEYYSYELIKNLVEIPGFNYRLYSKKPIEYLTRRENITNKIIKMNRFWSQIGLSIEMLTAPPDALFVPAHTLPIYPGKKSVVTIHDLGFIAYPELYTPLERNYHRFCASFSARHSTKIIAVSQATKKDIVSNFKIDPQKITVIYHGFDNKKYFPVKETQHRPEFIKKLGSYIYYIGRLEAKKNIINLIKAFALLRGDKKVRHKLVLAGRPGFKYDEIRSQIEELPQEIQNDVIELGYVEDEKAVQLMRFADIFAFPSKFEGFGMPLVEAMASGVPVVASNTTSIPEICAGAALLCPPDDFEMMAKSFKEIISDDSARRNLINLGLKQSLEFSWQKCASETLEVIKSAL